MHDNMKDNICHQNEVHPLWKFSFSKLDSEEYRNDGENMRDISSKPKKYNFLRHFIYNRKGQAYQWVQLKKGRRLLPGCGL